MSIKHCVGQIRIPQTDQEFWQEEALCYHPGKMLDVGACMMGFQLMLQDDKGQYVNSSHTLIFEGSMLVYDPQCDIAQWVHVQGVSASLTMMELHMVNDLSNMVPSPNSEFEPVRPPSPEIIKGVLVGPRAIQTAWELETPGMNGIRQRSVSGHAAPLQLQR